MNISDKLGDLLWSSFERRKKLKMSQPIRGRITMLDIESLWKVITLL